MVNKSNKYGNKINNIINRKKKVFLKMYKFVEKHVDNVDNLLQIS